MLGSLLALVVVIVITLGIGIAAIIYGPSIIDKLDKLTNNNNQTNQTITNTNIITPNQTILIPNQTNGNFSDFKMNVTKIVSFQNGTYLVTVQDPISKSRDKNYQDNIIKIIKKQSGQFSNICTIVITTKDNAEPRLIYEKHNSIACKPPVIPPVVNETTPPVINNTVDNDTIPNPIPNKSPVIEVTTPISVETNKTVNIQAKVSDPDGIVTQIIWNEESETDSNFTSNGGNLTFTPIVAGAYIFSVEAIDNNGSSTLKSVTVNAVLSAPIPIPVPTPQPTSNQTLKVIMTGDIENSPAGIAVFNQIKVQNPDNVIILGDLGYQSNLAWFKSTYGTLGNKINCVIGNHESSNEDGSASLQAEATAYCADSYYIKKNHVLFLGFNTNGNLNTQLGSAQQLVMNPDFMNGIKSVHIMSHKDCAAPPNSHHTVESKVLTFCNSLKAKIPTNVKVYFDQAHNHVMSASVDGTYKQIGAGGKSHYTCGVSAAFPFCDNVHFGFLEYIIKPDGTTTSSFMDYNGKVIQK